MYQDPHTDFIYSAYKIESAFINGSGTKIAFQGTAFVVALNSIPFFVTNRHLIEPDYKRDIAKYLGFKLLKIRISGRRPDDTKYAFELDENSNIYYHEDYNNDVILIRGFVESSQYNIIHHHFDISDIANDTTFSTIIPFDLICYTGFPGPHDKLDDRPIIRGGRIASDPRYNYSYTGKSNGSCVAYEGFSHNGSSGSPILAPTKGYKHATNFRHGSIIGVNSAHVTEGPQHSGISYFYKSTVIHEILEKNNLKSAPTK